MAATKTPRAAVDMPNDIASPSNAVPRPNVEAVAPAWEAATMFVLAALATSAVVFFSISPRKPFAYKIALICFLLRVD